MFEPGAVIDGVWVVDQRLGKGGMGAVYRCHNIHAPRILAAIKILKHQVSEREDVRLRFVREAELLFTLDHPQIVKVRNVRLDASPPYLEMAFVEGKRLDRLFKMQPFDTETALALIAQLVQAVAYLHEMGVFHRDIKPANILIQGDRLTLVDFGLAWEDSDEQITVTDLAFGTVSYAPPEWIQKGPLDPLTWDIYAIGVVLYEMVTGTIAFPVDRTEAPRQQALKVMSEKQDRPYLDIPDAPAGIRALVQSMTSRAPADRPPSMLSVVGAIDALRADRMADAVKLLQGTVPPPSGSDSRQTRKEPDSRMSTRGRIVWLPALVGFFGSLLILFLLGVAAVSLRETKPSLRDVEVVVAGLSESDSVSVRLGNVMPSERHGFTHAFRGIPHGEVEVTWAAGSQGCGERACPGAACPSFCATGAETWDIPVGEAVLVRSLEVAMPGAAAVVVAVRGGGEVVTGQIGAQVADWVDGRLHLDDIPCGPAVLRVSSGTCAPDAPVCVGTPGGCGACVVLEQKIEIPISGLELSVDLPVPKRARSVPAPATVKEDRGSSGTLVSRDVFVRWVDRNPAWRAEAAVKSGNADGNYLKGITAGPGPMVNVSWAAAQAFCGNGLATIEQSPTTWAESEAQPFQEWRVGADGSPAWRRFDGATSAVVRREESNAFTGFRCR